MRYMPIKSAMATRWMLHLAFRDAHTALDLTYGAGRFWQAPLPPGLTLTSNNLDPKASADLHLDFTATGLPDGAYDLVVFDPPHIADGGANGIMAARYGTVKGIAALRELIEAGASEAWRISRVGVLVKVADHAHSTRHRQLTRWVEAAIGAEVYSDLHTFKPVPLADGKRRAVRVPRNNGATYMAFRKAGGAHVDFDRLYERQQARARKAPAA
jgi:hypothetical protein